MAKPDTDDGWFKMAVELEAALAFAGFSKVARTLLRYAFTQVYGRGTRPLLAYLPQKDIATRIGQKRQNVQRALVELVESGVLVEARDDQYRFVKDYEKWTTWSRDQAGPCGPRLTAKEVEDCKDAPAYARAFQLGKGADPASAESSNGITSSNPTGLPESSNWITGSNPTGLPESSNWITGSAGAIEDRARVQREIERKREGERAPARMNRNPSLAQIRAAEHRERLRTWPDALRAIFEAEAEKDRRKGRNP